MKIVLTPKESEEHFYNALCNGISQLGCSGLEFDYSATEYRAAKERLNVKYNTDHLLSICMEDVFMEILRGGGSLTIKDVEGEGDMTRSITLKEVHERVQKTPLTHLQNMIDECDDAETADVILQTVFFEDIIFG